MRNIGAAIWAESLKVRRSKIFWIMILAFSFITIVMALMMYVLKNPELARKTGLLGAKAQLIGEANWSSYFSTLAQIISIGGLVGFGFIASWIFGREFSDHTSKDLLALPIARSKIVLAKFIVMFIWCLLLSLIVLGIGVLAGKIVNIAGWTGQMFLDSSNMIILTSILTIIISTPVAFFASYGRGFLPPLGYVVMTIIISQFAAALGHGTYFPWAIPALYTGAAGQEIGQLGTASFVIVFITGIIGILTTVYWWCYADHN